MKKVRPESTPILNAGPVKAVVDAMLDKSGWDGTKNEGHAEHAVSIGDPFGKRSLAQREAAQSVVLALDDSHVQTFLLILAHWLANNEPGKPMQPVTVTVNDLLEQRGLARHKSRDFHFDQKREERARCVHLSTLWVSFNERRAESTRSKKMRNYRTYVRLINLAVHTLDDGARGMQLFDDFPPDAMPYAFSFSPGSWISGYWDDVAHLGTLLGRVLGYKTSERSQSMAMRVALYLALAPHPETRLSVSRLCELARIPMPTVQPARFRACFEDALGRLRDDGVIAGWTYGDVGDPRRSGKGWFPEWGDTIVKLELRDANPGRLIADALENGPSDAPRRVSV